MKREGKYESGGGKVRGWRMQKRPSVGWGFYSAVKNGEWVRVSVFRTQGGCGAGSAAQRAREWTRPLTGPNAARVALYFRSVQCRIWLSVGSEVSVVTLRC